MARKLTAGVIVRHPGSGSATFLPPGSDLPDWAGGQVGEHALSPDKDRPPTEPPPKAGPGSTRAKWLSFAASRGVNLPQADASREDIIAACEAAGVPTD